MGSLEAASSAKLLVAMAGDSGGEIMGLAGLPSPSSWGVVDAESVASPWVKFSWGFGSGGDIRLLMAAHFLLEVASIVDTGGVDDDKMVESVLAVDELEVEARFGGERECESDCCDIPEEEKGGWRLKVGGGAI